MTVGYMEILGSDGATRPTLPLTRATRDAIAKYCELRWPTGRRKAVEREWGLSPDEARGICEATASATTVDKIWKHERGGWTVLLPVMGAVIGHGIDDYIAAKRRNHHDMARRSGALIRDLRAVGAADPDNRPDLESRSFVGRRDQRR